MFSQVCVLVVCAVVAAQANCGEVSVPTKCSKQPWSEVRYENSVNKMEQSNNFLEVERIIHNFLTPFMQHICQWNMKKPKKRKNCIPIYTRRGFIEHPTEILARLEFYRP